VTNAVAEITNQVTYLMQEYGSSTSELSDSELEGIIRNYNDYIIILNSLLDTRRQIHPLSRMDEDDGGCLPDDILELARLSTNPKIAKMIAEAMISNMRKVESA
jgi:hypothetical protein